MPVHRVFEAACGYVVLMRPPQVGGLFHFRVWPLYDMDLRATVGVGADAKVIRPRLTARRRHAGQLSASFLNLTLHREGTWGSRASNARLNAIARDCQNRKWSKSKLQNTQKRKSSNRKTKSRESSSDDDPDWI